MSALASFGFYTGKACVAFSTGSIAVDRINGGWWSSRGGNHKAREGRGCGSELEGRQSRKKRPVMILKKETGSGVISAFKKKKKAKLLLAGYLRMGTEYLF